MKILGIRLKQAIGFSNTLQLRHDYVRIGPFVAYKTPNLYGMATSNT
jgi:hypothetical protein